MYKINLPTLGIRLKQIREYIGYSQAQLAEKLGCKQNAISNIELGKGGSLTLLINLLNFYSEYVYIDLIFSERFYLISSSEYDEAKKAHYNSVIIELIKQSQNIFCSKIEDSYKQAQEELKENLQKAIDLLHP